MYTPNVALKGMIQTDANKEYDHMQAELKPHSICVVNSDFVETFRNSVPGILGTEELFFLGVAHLFTAA